MARQEVLKNLAETLNELFETPREKVVPEARLYEDLDLDSIDAIDLVIKIQSITGRHLVPQEFKHVRTVNDVLDCIERLLASDEAATS